MLALLAGAIAISTSLSLKKEYLVNNLALLNSLPHSSFDPLEADYSHNRPAMRMLYATPLEISSNNRLESSVLKSFLYDQQSQTISFKISPSAKYSDGTSVTINDISIAILRLVLKRPFFPVVRYIEGVEEWTRLQQPLRSLPKGITLEQDTLRIKLTKNLKNSLFRFTLEVFSIIPDRCIDLNTGKLICAVPTPSGHFTMDTQAPEVISFLRRYPVTPYGESLPQRMKISYLPPGRSDFANEIDDATVVVGWESSLRDPSQKALAQYAVRWLPRSWFTSLIINPNVAPFDDVNCRRLFAETFRKQFHALNDPESDLEASQMTSILPGYLSLQTLLEEDKSGNSNLACLEKLRTAKFRWAAVGGPATPFRTVIIETLKEFGQSEVAPIAKANYDEVLASFLNNETSILGYSSGFWAQDPVGDLQMYFTPGLHPILNFITGDKFLQTLLADLDGVDDSGLKPAMEKINRYLFNQSLSNVVAHVRKFYLAKNDEIISDPSFALSSPAPWQVFRDAR
jgi:hypothetical protein